MSFGEKLTKISEFRARFGITAPWIDVNPEDGSVHMLALMPPEEQQRIRELFAPLPAQEAMLRFFYEELRKPRRVSGTNQQILDRARIEHPEWPIPASIHTMRYQVDTWCEATERPKRPSRKG
jgi:hypothetical protein